MKDRPDGPTWALIRALFDELHTQDAAARRARIAAARLSPAATAELQSLLDHHDAATAEPAAPGADRLDKRAFLQTPASELLAAEPRPTAQPGQRLGAWQVVRAIGSGGMGEVFEARRADGQYEGRAAVKLLKRGMDSAAVLQRFALERQALARLSHPHIARLLDAGVSGDDLPYFVLEYIDGQPIDRAARSLALEKRIALFLQLADAVAHAHRNLLVHRDLKPGNVLVDERGQVKLLDFGIAKALDPLENARASGSTAEATLAGQRPYTPHYASPEQIKGEPVSTATDIYSLGVLLYQLLTGTRPTGRSATTPAEAARAVLEEPPTRPSRLTAEDTTDPTWPATRIRLQGDLDRVLLKALEKASEQRYVSVDAMAADLRAWLAGYPVSARPPSLGYAARLFVRRHRTAVSAAALGLGGVLLGTGAALARGDWAMALAVLGALAAAAGVALALAQARRAALARDAAQARFGELRRLAHAVLFDYHELIEPLPGSTPVRKRLVEDAIGYLEGLARAAPDEPALRREMGMAYRIAGYVQRNGFRRAHLGDTPGAMRSYASGIALLEELHAADPQDEDSAFELGLIVSARAGVWGEDGDLDAARTALERAATIFERSMARDRPSHRNRLELARTHLRLADVYVRNQRPDDALASAGRARSVLDSLAAIEPDHAELPHVQVWVHGLANNIHRTRGDWAAVRRELEQSGAIMARLHAQQPDNARFLEDLAGIAHWQLFASGRLGDVAGAERWGQEACRRWGEISRRDPEDQIARGNYLDALIASARDLVEAGAPARARERLAEIGPALAAAAERWPERPDVRARELLHAGVAAYVLQASGRATEASAAQAHADSLAAALTERFAQDPAVHTAALMPAFYAARSLARQAMHASALRAQAASALRACITRHEALVQRRLAAALGWAQALDEAPRLLRDIEAAAGNQLAKASIAEQESADLHDQASGHGTGSAGPSAGSLVKCPGQPPKCI